MRKVFPVVVALLSVACASHPVASSPRDVAAVPVGASSAPATSTASASRPGSDLELGPFELSSLGSPSCTEATTARGYYGFYRTDAWEQGNTVLTFDDGPHPTATPRVLDLLDGLDLPATFFVVGRAINRDTYQLVQRIVADGHTLGSHSYSHDVKMTKVGAPDASVRFIVGQHETTAILVDLSLMAKSGDDFDAMFSEVFESDPGKWLTGTTIRDEHDRYMARHQDLLEARGYENGARPYTVLYSRPPGGGPYVEHDGAAGIAIHDAALKELKMMNVMWHGASGDTVPEKRSDFGFLRDNLGKYSKSGGVLLIHDYIRADALAAGLGQMVEDPSVKVVPIADAVQKKYGCDSNALSRKLRGVLGGGVFAGAAPSPLPAGLGG